MTMGLTQPIKIEYQEYSWTVKRCRRVSLTISPPPLSLFSGKYGNLDVSQPYDPLWPILEIALLSFYSVLFVNSWFFGRRHSRAEDNKSLPRLHITIYFASPSLWPAGSCFNQQIPWKPPLPNS
jgi:hypothetical protein